jgi:hypothetical protein
MPKRSNTFSSKTQVPNLSSPMKVDERSVLDEGRKAFALTWPLSVLFAVIGAGLLILLHLSIQTVVWMLVLCGTIVGVLRYLLQRSTGNKETTAYSELAKELNAAAEALPDADKKIQKAISLSAHVQAKTTVTANPTVVSLQTAKELRSSMGRDLEFLVQLATVMPVTPRAAIEQSWEILEQNVVEMAKLFGFKEEGVHDPIKAVYYTNLFLKSKNVTVGMSSLAAGFQKVEGQPHIEVAVRDAQDFVKYSTAIVADLSFEVDRTLESEKAPRVRAQ